MLEILAGGPLLVEEVLHRGQEKGIKRPTLFRAAKGLGIERVRQTAAGGAVPGCYRRLGPTQVG